MFSKDMLIGIILGMSKTDIYLIEMINHKLGYRVKT